MPFAQKPHGITFFAACAGAGGLLQFQCSNFTLREVPMQDDADGDAAPYHSITNV